MADRGNSPFGDGDPTREIVEWAQRHVRPILIWGGLILFVGVGLFTSMYSVAPEGRAVVKRFGKVVAIEEPGLQFKLPFWIDTATFVPTERVLKEEFGFRTVQSGEQTSYAKTPEMLQESLMLTGDLNVIDVEWVVQYRIRDPDLYLHRVRKPTGSIRDISEAVMRRIVGNRLGSEVLTVGRVDLAGAARDEIQSILDGERPETGVDYNMGTHIGTVEMQDVTPPDVVKPAFNEVNEARQERERLINEAEKRRNQLIPRANGEAEQTIAEAQAYKAARTNAARGEASRFTAILQQYQLAQDVTRRRLYLEAMDEILPQAGRIVILEPGVAPPLPLLELGPQPAAPRRIPDAESP